VTLPEDYLIEAWTGSYDWQKDHHIVRKNTFTLDLVQAEEH
jgi:hypothetical protein